MDGALSARLPSQQQVIELLEGEFARAGYEIEDVVVDAAARPPRITVVADGDEAPGPGLDRGAVAVGVRTAGRARRRSGRRTSSRSPRQAWSAR